MNMARLDDISFFSKYQDYEIKASNKLRTFAYEQSFVYIGKDTWKYPDSDDVELYVRVNEGKFETYFVHKYKDLVEVISKSRFLSHSFYEFMEKVKHNIFLYKTRNVIV
jgi:hypothetical protein